MKRTLATLIIGMVFQFSYAQQSIYKQNLHEGGFSGNVKSILEKTVINSEDGSRQERPGSYLEYDKQGNKVLSKSFSGGSENAFSQKVITYDAAKNILEVKDYRGDVLTGRQVYEYDAQNRKTKEMVYAENGSLHDKSLFSYDAAGNMVEKQSFLGETYFVLKQTYEYDKNGNRLSLRHYNEKDVLTYEYLYKYDKRNNKIEQTHRKNGVVVQVTNYTYNEKNELVKLVQYDNNQLTIEYEYTYSNGINTETVSHSPKSQSKSIGRNNEKGLTIESIEYRNEQQVTVQTYWYDYDAAGNWIRRYNSYNGESPSIVEREIQYY